MSKDQAGHQDLRGSCQGKLAEDDLSINTTVLETFRGKVRASQTRFNGLILQMGKARPYTGDPFVMTKPPPWGGLGCHPVPRATAQRSSLSHWPRSARAETAGEAQRIPRAGRGAAREVAPPPGLGSLTKFVNTGGGGRAPLRTSEQRGGASAAGRRDHSPDAAKRPEAQSSTPQSAASRREPGMLGHAACGVRAPTVQPAGLPPAPGPE